jgi:hypothetical protein
MDSEPHFFWTVTDPLTKRRRQTRYRMTEKDARERHGDDAHKVEWSGITYRDYGRTSDFLKPRSEAGNCF